MVDSNTPWDSRSSKDTLVRSTSLLVVMEGSIVNQMKDKIVIESAMQVAVIMVATKVDIKQVKDMQSNGCYDSKAQQRLTKTASIVA